MIRTIYASGWQGAVGILSHRDDADAAETLQKNLDGYAHVVARAKLPEGAPPPAPKAK